MELQLDSSVEIENLLRFLRNADRGELCVLVATNYEDLVQCTRSFNALLLVEFLYQ